MSERISLLQGFIEEDPDDPFNWYALALEYQKTDLARAIEVFRTLVDSHASYIPTYYQFAQALEQLGQHAEAVRIYDLGIIEASKAEDVKAMRELAAAREILREDIG
jgi:tetratricopeptide (TPR) repeat protein